MRDFLIFSYENDVLEMCRSLDTTALDVTNNVYKLHVCARNPHKSELMGKRMEIL